LSDLYNTISARCRGKTLVVGSENTNLIEVINERSLDVKYVDNNYLTNTQNLNLSKGVFKTIVLLDEHQLISEQELSRTISVSWRLLKDGGHLILCVPNQESIERNLRLDYLKLRNLKKRLKPLGKLKIVREQPFKWLLLYVTKLDSDKFKINESNKARINVTSKLCYGKVIELGCGRGHITKAISDRGSDVTGIDISKKKIAEARELYPNLNFIQSDILKLEFPNESFDTAVLAEVIEHVPADLGSKILSIAWNLLKQGGRLIVSVPNEDSILHHNHLRTFNRATLKKMLCPYGNPKVVTDQPYKWLMMYVDRKMF